MMGSGVRIPLAAPTKLLKENVLSALLPPPKSSQTLCVPHVYHCGARPYAGAPRPDTHLVPSRKTHQRAFYWLSGFHQRLNNAYRHPARSAPPARSFQKFLNRVGASSVYRRPVLDRVSDRVVARPRSAPRRHPRGPRRGRRAAHHRAEQGTVRIRQAADYPRPGRTCGTRLSPFAILHSSRLVLRHSSGIVNVPAHIPRCVARARSSASTYAIEYLRNANCPTTLRITPRACQNQPPLLARCPGSPHTEHLRARRSPTAAPSSSPSSASSCSRLAMSSFTRAIFAPIICSFLP